MFGGSCRHHCLNMSPNYRPSPWQRCCANALDLTSHASLCKWQVWCTSPEECGDWDWERQTATWLGHTESWSLSLVPPNVHFPLGLPSLIAIATWRGRAIVLEACVSFKVTVLKPKASGITSENSSPLLRGGAGGRDGEREESCHWGQSKRNLGTWHLKSETMCGRRGEEGSPAVLFQVKLWPDLDFKQTNHPKGMTNGFWKMFCKATWY